MPHGSLIVNYCTVVVHLKIHHFMGILNYLTPWSTWVDVLVFGTEALGELFGSCNLFCNSSGHKQSCSCTHMFTGVCVCFLFTSVCFRLCFQVCVSAFGAAMSDVDLQAFVLLTSIRWVPRCTICDVHWVFILWCPPFSKQLGRLVPQRVLVPVCLSAVEDLRTREKVSKISHTQCIRVKYGEFLLIRHCSILVTFLPTAISRH